MDLRRLKKLIDLVQESGIAELEITEGEEKVKIVKGGAVSIAPASAATLGLGTAPAPAEARPAPAAPAAPPAAEPEAGQEGHVVKAPMVGTSYRSAPPDAEPVVEVGQTIKEGQTTGIIEAMQLVNANEPGPSAAE